MDYSRYRNLSIGRVPLGKCEFCNQANILNIEKLLIEHNIVTFLKVLTVVNHHHSPQTQSGCSPTHLRKASL